MPSKPLAAGKNTPEVADILADCPLFAQVDAAGRSRLAAMGTLRRFRRGQTLFHQADPCPGLFVVASGRVRIFKTAASGRQHVLHLVGPGQTFAEVATIGRFPCPAAAEALEPTLCLLLPARPFNALLERDHSLCLQLMGGLAGWVRRLVDLLEEIVLHDAASRVARYLLRQTDGARGTAALPRLKAHLASHLGLTGETLSRCLRRFEDDHLIARAPAGRVRLLDPEALAEIGDAASPALPLT